MNQTRFEIIIKKYQEGRLTEDERVLLDQWMDEISKNGQSVEWNTTEFSSLRDRVLDNMIVEERAKSSRPVLKLWIAAISAACLLIFAGYLVKNRISNKQEVLSASSILPVNDQATITLENGDVVTVENGKSELVLDEEGVFYKDGSSLLKGTKAAHQSQKLKLHTPKGKVISIVLEDGSKVWLNANSTLTYPLKFADHERKVELDGEGYFDISHQFIAEKGNSRKRKPFLVVSEGQNIEVIGTKFNVKSYANDESIKTNLLSGIVSVKNKNGENILLKPNQQALLNKANQKVKISQVDAEESIGWMNNIFTFHNADLKEIMSEIERWYDIKVVVNKWPADRFYGEIKRSEPLSEVLQMIEASSTLRFKIIQVQNERRLILQ